MSKWLDRLLSQLPLHRFKQFDSNRVSQQLSNYAKNIKTNTDSFIQNVPKYQENAVNRFNYVKQQSRDTIESINNNENFKYLQSRVSETGRNVGNKIGSKVMENQTVQQLSKNLPSTQDIKQNIDSVGNQINATKENMTNIGNKVSDSYNNVKNTVSRVSSIPSNVNQSVGKRIESFSSAKQGAKSRFGRLKRLFNLSYWKQYFQMKENLRKLKIIMISYAMVGVFSYGSVSSMSYLGITYLIRNRNNMDYNQYIEMFCKWLNIPYNVENPQLNETNDTNETNTANTNENKIEKFQENSNNSKSDGETDNYKLHVDIKIANFAYHATFYPRAGCSILLTILLGTPLVRLTLFLLG